MKPLVYYTSTNFLRVYKKGCLNYIARSRCNNSRTHFARAAFLILILVQLVSVEWGYAQSLPCNYRAITTSNFSTSIIAARSLAIGGGTVANTSNVIDASLTNFGTITTVANVLSGGSIDAQTVSTTFLAGSTAGYVVDNPAFLNASVLATSSIKTYLNGVQQDVSSSATPLVEFPDLAASGQRVVGIVTTKPFNEIQITFSANLSTASTLKIYNPFVLYPTLSLTVTATNASGPAVSDGVVSVSATGGRTPLTYTYTGPNTATTTSGTILTGRAPGSYSVTVTDANGCTDTEVATVGSPTPFACAPNVAYLVSSPATPNSTARRINLITGVATIVGTDIATGNSVNGLGFNPVDNYLWGVLSRNSAGNIANTIVRFDANFAPTYYTNGVSVVAGTNSADIDKNGVYHLYNGNSGTTVMQRINLSSGTPTQLASLTLSQTIPIGDMAFSPVDNNLYSLTQTTALTSPVLYRITVPTAITSTVTTATVTRLGPVTGGGINTLTGLNTSRFFGAIYMDGDGNFYAQDNSTGNTYRIASVHSLTANQANITATLVSSTSLTVQDNDGARCPTAPVAAEATFAFNCGTATVTGSFTANSTGGQSGTLVVPITGTTAGIASFTVLSTGFAANPSLYTTTLTAGQTVVSIPITYDGSGLPGSRTLVVDSEQATSAACSVTVTINGQPDLTTSIGQPAAAPVANQPNSLPITISNIGNVSTSGAISSTITLPANVTAPATFTTNGFSCSTSGSRVTCSSSGSITNGASTTFAVPFTPAVATIGTFLSFTNTVATSREVNTANNTAIVTIMPAVAGQPDLITSIGQPAPNLVVGQTSSLPISVSNIGTAATSGVITQTLTIPASVTVAATFTSNGFSCTTASGVVSCANPAVLTNGSSLTFAIPITPTVAGLGSSPVFSTTVLTDNESNTTNNTASTTVTTPVAGQPDLTMSLGQPAPTLAAGATGTLPVSVSNIGTAITAGPVTITLTIPASVTASAAFTSNGFSCTTVTTRISCTSSATITTGNSITLAVPITPLAAAIGTVVFTATVLTGNESTTANNTATVTVTVSASITANPDAGTASAGTGGTAVANVTTNDVVNGEAPVLGTGGNATVASVGTYPAGITLNTTTGSINVATGTAPGSYTVAYQLCDKLTTPTCATGLATITVTPNVVANPDAGTISAGTGGTAVANVTTNDFVNGVAARLGTNANARVAIVGTYPTGITLNTTTGSLSVAVGTTPGSYTVAYQLCDLLTSPTCATATVFVTVTPSVNPTPDSGTVCAGIAVTNVAANDLVNSQSATLGVNATVSSVGTYPAGITLNTTTGSLSVTNGVAVGGTYVLTYQLCSTVGTPACMTSTATVTVNPSVTATLTSATICNGTSTMLTAGGAGTGGSYVLNPGSLTSTSGIFVLSPTTNGVNTYTLTAISQFGCTGTATGTVTVNPSVTAILTSATICNGTSATLTATGGSNYLFSNATTNTTGILVVSPTNNGTSFYSVTVTSGQGCSAVASGSVVVNPSVNPTLSVATVCNGTSTTLTATGGSTYRFSEGTTNTTGILVVTPTNNGSNPYSVTVTSAQNCSAVATGNVTVNPSVTATLSSATICNGTTVSLTATGGVSYRFGPGNTSTSGILTVAPTTVGSNPYSVTVTSSQGCTAVAFGTVTVNALPQPTISGSASVCTGQPISLTASPTTGLTYAWSGPGGNLGSSNPLTIINSTTANSGTYQVTVTDGNGCTAVASQNVSVKPTPRAQILNTSITCANNSPAVAIATQVTGGAPPIGYTWYRSGAVGVISTSPNPVFSAADTYSLIVTDANGCLSNTATVTVMTPDPLAVNVQTANPRCFNAQGTITVTTNGGSSPYTVSYYNAGGVMSTTTTNGVSTLQTVAGSYTIVVMDANGCSLTQTAALTQPPQLVVTLTGSGSVCTGQNTGSISSSATGGTTPYSYSWTNGSGQTIATTRNVTNLSGGTYSVVVTDANGCITSQSITLPTNPLPNAPTFSVTQPTCTTTTGTIQILSPSTGVQYSFNNGISYQVSSALAGLSPDVYQLRVKDGVTGCVSLSTSATVNAIPNPPVASIAGNTTYCAGQPISLTASPASNVTYAWRGPAGNLGSANPLVITNTTSAQTGAYQVTVTDVNGCTAMANTSVIVYALPVATLTVNSSTMCYGQPIILTASGGNGYTFSSNVNGISGNTASFTAALGTAQYSVTVTSSQGCLSLPAMVTVTVSSCIDAQPDSGTVSAGTAGVVVANVVSNDRVNTLPVILGSGGNATISGVGSYPAGISLNPATGSISVTAGVAVPGSYTVVYQLCDRLTPVSCATNTVSITVLPSINPTPDSGTASAGTGGVAVVNVATNDVVNGKAAVLGSNATVSGVGSYPAGISLNPATGSISVTAGVAVPGSYTVVYQLCDRLTPMSCATTTVSITVLPSINPTPDSGTASAGTGGVAVVNVAANDVVNGQAAVLGSNATVSEVDVYPAGISLNPATGSISVTAGVAVPGSYTVVYQLCSTAGTPACATTTVSIRVLPSINPTPDSGTASAGTGGVAVVNVATNDVVNGQAAVLGGNATVSGVGTYPAGISLNPATGSISVTAGVAVPGSYTVVYQLCDRLTPVSCATNTVSITVLPSINPTPDSGTASAGTGGVAVVNVATNDVVNGKAAVLGSNATVSGVGAYPAGISLNPATGSISVTAGLAVPGSYTLVYQLCDRLTPVSCATTTVSITVLPSINPAPDSGTASAGTGGVAVVNVVTNDVVNGQAAVLGGNATVSGVGTYPAGISLNPATGSISVTAGVAVPGSYTLVYQLCDRLTPISCATTTVSITVLPSINPTPDSGTVTAGTAVDNVATNDVVNGQPAVLGDGGNATVAIAATYPGITLDPITGSIYVDQSTAPGNYTVTYQLCDLLTAPNCATTTVAITVLPVIVILSPVNNSTATLSTTISGTTNPGNVVVLTGPAGTTLCSTTATAAGSYSCVVNVPSGPNSITAVATNGGLVSAPAVTSFTAIAPPTIVITSPRNVLTNSTPTISGTATPGSRVVLTGSGNTTLCVTTASQSGDYSCLVTVPAGPQTITAVATNAAGVSTPATTTFNVSIFVIQLKVLLQGALIGSTTVGIMRDDLRQANLIPTTEPYSNSSFASSFTHVGGGGGETTTPAVLSVTSPNDAIVDWVFVELRDPIAPDRVIYTRSALVQRDGDVVDMDGVSPLSFTAVSNAYYVSVRHRNHLGVMTANLVLINGTVMTVDFTDPATATFGTNARQLSGGKAALWAGNASYSPSNQPRQMVIYQGPNNDVGKVLLDVLVDPDNYSPPMPTYIVPKYLTSDLDMDGRVIYQGVSNDLRVIFSTVLLHPGNSSYLITYIVSEQLP